jgi:hypothetical protein
MMGQTLVPKRWFEILTRHRVITHKEDKCNIMNHGESLKFNKSVGFLIAHFRDLCFPLLRL